MEDHRKFTITKYQRKQCSVRSWLGHERFNTETEHKIQIKNLPNKKGSHTKSPLSYLIIRKSSSCVLLERAGAVMKLNVGTQGKVNPGRTILIVICSWMEQ